MSETSLPGVAASTATQPPTAHAAARSRKLTPSARATVSRARGGHIAPALVVSDVTSVAAATTLAALVSPAGFWTSLLVVALAWAALGGVPQRPTLALSTLEQIPWLTRRMATSFLLGSPLTLLGNTRPALGHAALVAVTVLVGRAITNVILRRRRQRGIGLEPTLMVGATEATRRFVHEVGSSRRFGLRFVGVIEDASTSDETAESDQLGSLADLPSLVEGLGVRRVIVGPEVPGGPERTAALRRTLTAGARVHLIPRMSEVVPTDSPPYGELVVGHPLIELPRPMAGGVQCGLKRLIDVVTALMLVVLLAPVMALVAVGVRRSSPGPVLFRQLRVGRNGGQFIMFKFRTFPVDHVDVVQSLNHDACPLRFGRFLRRSSLDELPQLLNVLRGEMSLIGPRPERPHFVAPMVERFPEYDDRHRVRGGMTGLAQTMGYVGDTPIQDRIRLDNRYIDGWSLWQDAIIAARTFAALFRKAWH